MIVIRRDSLDVAPLADRLLYLTWFRLVVVLVVGALLPFLELSEDVTRPAVAAATMTWLAVTTCVSGALWASGKRHLPVVSALMLLDGLYLVAIVHVEGGLLGPLACLVPLHLVTVSLLASFRTGLKLALWHSLLLLVVRDAVAAGLLPVTAEAASASPLSTVQFVGVLTGVWLSTLASCGYAAVNERELRRRRYDLEALAQFSAELERALDPAEIAQLLADNTVDRFDARRAVVLLVDSDPLVRSAPAGWALTPTEQPGLDEDLTQVGSVLRPGPSRVAHGTALLTRLDAAADPWLSAVLGRHANLVVLPLTDGDAELGVLVLEHGTRRGSGIERRLVAINERAVSQAALALAKARLVKELRALATTDALTGAANRRTFDLALEQGLVEAAGSASTLNLVMVDVDHFKTVNDVHGHATGDEVLRTLATVLRDATRPEDLVARYGGEEFAVVLPGLTTAEALAVGERLRALVAAMAGPVPVTASFGVAGYPADSHDRRTLALAADQALYRAKHAGRNQVCGAEVPSGAK